MRIIRMGIAYSSEIRKTFILHDISSREFTFGYFATKLVSESLKQWRLYIGARGAKPTPHKSGKKKDLAPTIPRVYTIVFAGLVTLTELTGSALYTYEANEATAS